MKLQAHLKKKLNIKTKTLYYVLLILYMFINGWSISLMFLLLRLPKTSNSDTIPSCPYPQSTDSLKPIEQFPMHVILETRCRNKLSRNISVHVVTTLDGAKMTKDALRRSKMIGVDCEGVNLSRQPYFAYFLCGCC